MLPNFSQFWLEEKKASLNFGQEREISVGALRTPPQSITLHFCMKCVAWYNISAKSKMCPDTEYQQQKGIMDTQTNENIFGEVGCLLVLVIILVWGCCNVGTGVEMVPNLKSKKDSTTLRSKNHLLRG